MSSDRAAARRELALAAARGRYRWTLGLLLLAGVALCGVLAAVLLLSGPRLVEVQADGARLSDAAGGRVVLRSSEWLGQVDAAQITVEPAAEVTPTVRGRELLLQFRQPLRYGTEYRIRIDGVIASRGGPASDFEAVVETPDPELFYLQRGSGTDGQDQVIRTRLGDASREVVFQAPGIQYLAELDGRLLVSTYDGSASSLWAIDLEGRSVDELPLPEGSYITQMRAVQPALFALSLLRLDIAVEGFEVVELFRIDMQAGGELEPVLGLDGEPLRVQRWLPIPGGSKVLVRTADTSVLSIDLRDQSLLRPYGRYRDAGPVAIDGSIAQVQDIEGRWLLDLDTGERSELPDPPPASGALRTGVELALLGDGALVQRMLDLPEGATHAAETETSVWLLRDGAWSELFRPGEGQTVEAVSLSPNGQFLAAELADRAGEGWDGMPANPKPIGVTTVLIDLGTGVVTKTFSGFDILW